MPPIALEAAKDTTFTTAELLAHWTLFGHWASYNGVSLLHPADWMDWWQLYVYAAYQENQRL